jgi:hypothetical protein
MNDELRVVQKMLGALMRHQGLLQWVDRIAFGQNDGGVYCSLFNSKAAFRVGTVYSEQFYKLPDFVQAIIPQDAGEISTERARVEKAGKLIEVPGFMITRYKLNADDEQEKWRFGDVLYVAKSAAQASTPANAQPAPEPAPAEAQEPAAAHDNPFDDPVSVANPPQFKSMNEAIKWGVECGVFADYGAAKKEYERVKRVQAPNSAARMFAAWIAEVQMLAQQQVGAR